MNAMTMTRPDSDTAERGLSEAPLRAVSVAQPWATLLACGATRILALEEPTRHRGPIAIHAAGDLDEAAISLCMEGPVAEALAEGGYRRPGCLPRDTIVGLATVTSCLPLGSGSPALERMLEAESIADVEELGDTGVAWVLEGARRVVPAQTCGGGEGLWALPERLARVLA
jgi:activating signal cointegrator 1